MLFLNGPSALAFEVGAGSEKMRLTSTGLGIGTQSPNTTLTLSDGTDEFDFGVTANLLMIKSVTADGSDDHRIIIDAGNGGTTSTRGAYLALSGNEAASEAGKAIYQMGNVTGSAHVFRKAGGVDAVTIDSSGNVSIGTVVPSVWHGQETALQIGSTALSDYSVGGANVSAIYNNAYRAANNNAVYKETDFASNYSQYNGRHTFNVAASGTAGDDISWIQAMRIDASGNVGIGTDAVTSPGLWYDTNPGYLAISHWATPPTPAAMLHLSDNSNDLDVPQIRIEGRENAGDTVLDIAVRDAAVRLNLVEGATDAGNGYGQMIFKTNAAANAASPTRGGFLFSTLASANNLVITNTGKVGIGTATPAAKLHVKTSGADGIVLDQDTGSTNNSSRLFFNSTSGNWAIFNNSHNLNFQSGATAGASSGNYTDFTIATSGVICRRQLHISSDNLKVDSGYGIDFSSNNQHGAVTGASSTSEVLDDYEEGTWTPTISHNDGTGVIPLTVSQASYVKIGRLVHVRCYLTAINPAGNAGTSSPYYGIRGMPFSAAGYGSWQIVYASSGITSYGGYTSAASLYFLTANGSSPMGQSHTTGTVINSWGSNVVFMMSASYQTA